MKKLYFLIRIPKSGSTTMRDMVEGALPDSRNFRLPLLASDSGVGITFYDRLRRRRRTLKGFWKGYRTFREAVVWQTISQRAKEGDILSGHLRYGSPQLPEWNLQCITLLRNPVERLVSDYHYSLKGFQKRSFLQRCYNKGVLHVAGTRTLSDYIHYLHEHRQVFGNPATSYVVGSNTEEDPFEFMRRNYFHFGVLEELEVFSTQLSQKLNRPVAAIWSNKTRRTGDQPLSPSDKVLLEELLDKDIALYQKTVDFVRAGKAAQPALGLEV